MRILAGSGYGGQVLVHQVLPGGELQRFGTLYPLVGGGFWMQEADKSHGQSEFHPSLPWFLMDTRPQGFLGRAFAQTHAELGLPPQLGYWSDDHIRLALVRAGDAQTLCLLDAFGALIANTDRHHGNVSLLLHQHRWQLAPAYDMLPMY